ncbi:hypothetical protein MTBPR1_100193 [Candidatus Terasakiella magnetica]|uniref:Response regulatory domain-containing protein n=1 Tax=Candidatus Terasakiella magnetica TaxID=1867952 RepID=A0A1C3RE88_9PROT|nr:response regulator [Candidatus Terasakiella magnetica]SCA55552.1 hypothetical protein MTBPR1_100193 [Candidatus Terasakiella magnetica]
MNVLLLEPYTGMRVMVRGVLRAMEIDTLFEPRSSLEAMQILLTDKVDFFICSDTVKPLDALICIKLIRNSREDHIRHIRTIISIDTYEEDDIKKLIDAGADYTLMKPFSADDITSQINRLITKRAGFIETRAYVGPDRRHWQAPIKHAERRDDTYNPGRAVFNHSLRKLIQRLFDLQAKKQNDKDKEREEDLKARGILIEGNDLDERECPAHELEEGMTLLKPVYSDHGMLVVPAGHALGNKTISRLLDLVAADRITDMFSVMIPPQSDAQEIA